MPMSNRGKVKVSWIVLAMAIAAPPSFAFGPGEAAGGRRPVQAARPGSPRADFLVLIWYRRDDPLGTFEHQVYDVRKGEYTPAVEDWVRDTTARYPSYRVVVRPVDLSRERGQTEKLKVGSVIYRELLATAADSGVILGAPVNLNSRASASRSQTTRSDPMPTPDRSFLNPGPNNLNIPVYPRTRTP